MKQQRGFSIIMAIFILVVLSLLGGYMVKLSGVQHTTALNVIQGARAYQAAKASVSWSIAKISSGGNCSDVTSVSPLSFTGINGFSVTLDCNKQVVPEDGVNLNVYHITALSEFGVFKSASYISRNLEVSIIK